MGTARGPAGGNKGGQIAAGAMQAFFDETFSDDEPSSKVIRPPPHPQQYARCGVSIWARNTTR